ncbi:MAG: hypothetical protein FWC84_05420 [Alphaproteobacteria bacterium]|nr:hypothetical protein [Alphaproteobacteria bacterium]
MNDKNPITLAGGRTCLFDLITGTRNIWREASPSIHGPGVTSAIGHLLWFDRSLTNNHYGASKRRSTPNALAFSYDVQGIP